MYPKQLIQWLDLSFSCFFRESSVTPPTALSPLIFCFHSTLYFYFKIFIKIYLYSYYCKYYKHYESGAM